MSPSHARNPALLVSLPTVTPAVGSSLHSPVPLANRIRARNAFTQSLRAQARSVRRSIRTITDGDRPRSDRGKQMLAATNKGHARGKTKKPRVTYPNETASARGLPGLQSHGQSPEPSALLHMKTTVSPADRAAAHGIHRLCAGRCWQSRSSPRTRLPLSCAGSQDRHAAHTAQASRTSR